jgi:hypothetical protein
VFAPFLLLFQTTGTSPCSTPALCRLLQEADAVNRQAMNAGGGYTASVETESSTLGRREGRLEAPTLVEQTSGLARWSGNGGFDFHIVGARPYTNAIPLSRLAFLRIGWAVPTLAASRMELITRSGTTTHAGTLSGALAPEAVVHPLAEDREKWYSFAGGEAAQRSIDGAAQQVIVGDVAIRGDIKEEESLFEGELDLDPASKAVVRMFGRFRVVGRPKHLLGLPRLEPAATLVELVNQRLANGDWVPRVQRFEVQTSSSLTSGYGGGRRIISRWYNVSPLPAGAARSGIGSSTLGYAVSSAPRDTLRRFRGWHARPGMTSMAVADEDFRSWWPGRRRSDGKPMFLIQGLEKGEFIRYNRIEGAFTGLSAMVRLRDAAPGIFARVGGGYAWKEKRARGAADLGWESPRWTVDARVARSLDVTNDFRNQFDNPALAGVVGRDNWDYLERQGATLSLTRTLSFSAGSSVTLEGGRVEDRQVEPHVGKSLRGQRFRINRGITEGRYWRGRAVFDWNPEVSPIFVQDGVGFRAEVEHATGDLDYTRIEGRVVLRKSMIGMFFLARLHAGAVISDAPPPQQLFELGGPAGLPGYEYKEYAGDRAVLFRMRLTKPLGILDRPLHLSPAITFPSFSPAISIGFQGGFTDAHGAASLAAIRALGDRYDSKTGELLTDANGDALPASVATDKFRNSVDVRIGFFGDALAVGLAHALEKGRKTKLVIAFGRQF